MSRQIVWESGHITSIRLHNERGDTILDCVLCEAGEPMIHNYERAEDDQ